MHKLWLKWEVPYFSLHHTFHSSVFANSATFPFPFLPWRWGGSSTQAWMPTYVSILRIPQMIWVWRATVEWYWQVKTEELGEKPVPVPLCPPQIPHGLTRARTRDCAVRGWRLTTWAMARPKQCDFRRRHRQLRQFPLQPSNHDDSTLKMEITRYSETSVAIEDTIQSHRTEDYNAIMYCLYSLSTKNL
jgi:hypothetical protein